MTPDTAAVSEFLSADATPIGQGEWSQAFAFDCGGRRLVARFGAHGVDFQKDRIAARFSSPGLPIPEVYEIGEGPGGFFCVSERKDGTYLEEADAGEMRRLVPAVCRLLDALRHVETNTRQGFGSWDGSGNAPFASWPEFLLAVDQESERVPGWKAELEKFPAERAVFDVGREYLKAHAPLCLCERHLVHGDLLHRNVLVESGEIRGVLDWGCGLWGDFLYDLATFTFYAPWCPGLNVIDWEREAQNYLGDIPNFSIRLRCCEANLALGNMAYNASKGRPDHLKDNADRLRVRLGI